MRLRTSVGSEAMAKAVELSDLLDRPEALTGIGSELVKRAIVADIERRAGLPPSYAPNLRRVAVGERVPEDLVSKVPALDGSATDSWSDAGWTDVGVWERETWDKTGDDARSLRDISSLPPLDRMRLLQKLDEQDIEALRKLGLLPEGFSVS